MDDSHAILVVVPATNPTSGRLRRRRTGARHVMINIIRTGKDSSSYLLLALGLIKAERISRLFC